MATNGSSETQTLVQENALAMYTVGIVSALGVAACFCLIMLIKRQKTTSYQRLHDLPMAKRADALLKRFDVNGDGLLQRNEFHEFVSTTFPGNAYAPDALLAAIDADGDGTVGLNELRAFLRVYDPSRSVVRTKSCLVIIDVQNDFITGSLANQYGAEPIVPIINSMRDAFDLVVISMDWHPHHHCSFVESANDGKIALAGGAAANFTPFSMVTLKGDADRAEHPQMLYPRHAVCDTDGAACHHALDVLDSDPKIYKGTKPNIDSYSAFFDNCKANDTGLTALLEAEGITDVYCCGLVFDICVKSSALHGAEMGFAVTVIEDACRPLDAANVAGVKDELNAAGVAIMSAAEAIRKSKADSGQERTLKEFLKVTKRSKAAQALHSSMSMGAHAPSV